MCVTPEAEQQARNFLDHIAHHQAKLSAYACSLTKCPDTGHDLYSDTLLKCYERISSHGFYGEAYVPYLITAIKLNFYCQQRDGIPLDSLQELHDAPEAEGDCEDNHLARTALYTGVLSFVTNHYSQEHASIFELHLNGLTYAEIVFSAGCTYWHAYELVQRIKRDIRKEFGGQAQKKKPPTKRRRL